jgi:hypothetical protein
MTDPLEKSISMHSVSRISNNTSFLLPRREPLLPELNKKMSRSKSYDKKPFF